MLLADTGSLMYKTGSENVYYNLYKDKQLFDCISYPKDSKYYNGRNN